MDSKIQYRIPAGADSSSNFCTSNLDELTSWLWGRDLLFFPVVMVYKETNRPPIRIVDTVNPLNELVARLKDENHRGDSDLARLLDSRAHWRRMHEDPDGCHSRGE